MKRKFLFVGGLPSELMGVLRFSAFGQVEELDEAQAADAARGGCVILPADDPAAEAFTGDELKQYGSFGALRRAPADFQAKVKQARIAAAAFAAEAEAAHQAQATDQQVAGVKRG